MWVVMVDRAGFEPATFRDCWILSALRAIEACQADDLVASSVFHGAHTRLIYRPTLPSGFELRLKTFGKLWRVTRTRMFGAVGELLIASRLEN